VPYILEKRRLELMGDNAKLETPGELNYLVTVLINAYKEEKGLSYQTINDVVGALESCKLEFYRRVAVPYEEQKIKLNGDCY
jgi:hypothetical protein